MSENGNAAAKSPDAVEPACPMCRRRDQTVLCGECVHERIDETRRSVVEKERLNELMRQRIDGIFAQFHGPSSSVPNTGEPAQPFPVPSALATRDLAQHLQRLRVLNHQAKTGGIEHSIRLLERKNDKLARQIEHQRKNALAAQDDSKFRRLRLTESFHGRIRQLDAEIAAIRLQSVGQVSRQASLAQCAAYKVIRGAVFANIGDYDDQDKPVKGFLFMARPVLGLGDLSRSSLALLNTFLEDLVRLQQLLSELLQISDKAFQLPHMAALLRFLPDSTFYDSVQTHIDKLMEAPTPELDEKETSPVEPDQNYSKIVVHNNEIQVPVSFQTMNMKRRTSLRTPDIHATDTNDLHEVESPEPPPPESTSFRSHQTIVIVPHKFLAKPFTKLRPEELQAFQVNVAKILVNFNVLIERTLGRMPAVRPSGSNLSLMNTIHNLRGKSSVKQPEEFVYDLESLLWKTAHMDQYFQSEWKAPHTSTENPMGDSQISQRSETPDSLSSSWLLATKNSKAELEAKQSNLRNLYHKLVGTSKPQPFSALDKTIYGLISETENGKAAPKSEQTTGPSEAVDLNTIAANVASLIGRGGGRVDKSAQSTVVEGTRKNGTHAEDWLMVAG